MAAATLSVWRLPTVEGADMAIDTLQDLAKQQLVTVHDAATVRWEPGAKRPKTHQLNNRAAGGALGGSFWGLLLGLIFFVPLLGMAVGAAAGALGGAMTDVGIDDDFIRAVRQQVTPGTSALFVMTSNAVVDRVIDEFKESGATLVSTNLSKEQEAKLREAFAEE